MPRIMSAAREAEIRKLRPSANFKGPRSLAALQIVLAELDAERAVSAVLVEALKPFADFNDERERLQHRGKDDYPVLMAGVKDITDGDLRRSSAALAQYTASQEGE